MSLSNGVDLGESGSQSEIYEKFELKSFDTEGFSPFGEKGSFSFEPFYVSESDEEARFHHMTSDAREEAEKILEKVDEIVEEAKKKAASIERDAYEAGFAQGEKDGLEMGSKKLDKVIEPMHQILQEMLKHKTEFIARYEKEMLAFSCRIAEKIVRGRVKVDHDVVKKTIFEAFQLAADRSEVTIKLSPDDIDYVKDLRPVFFDRIKDLKSVTMESDPSISPGGCLMETAFGNVDARLESQLEKISASVENTFQRKHKGIEDLQS